MRELADGLLAEGHQPRLITSHPGPPRRRREDGLDVLRLPRPPEAWLARAHLESHLTHVPLSYAALCRGEAGIAHAMFPSDALAAVRWGTRMNRPAILSYMGIPRREWLAGARGRMAILRRVSAAADAVVVLSQSAAAAYAEIFGSQPEVIPPGVNLGTFRPGPRDVHPTILCAAAPEEPRKRVGLLVEAFGRLRHRLPEAQLILSRPAGADAARQAEGELSAPGVRWEDLDREDRMAEAIARSWVAVLPSAGEAFGLVLLEALAGGTPVVGFADGGIPEIAGDPAIGRLFHRPEPDSLLSALEEAIVLSQEPDTAERCRRHAEAFSTETMTRRYVELYARLRAARGLSGAEGAGAG